MDFYPYSYEVPRMVYVIMGLFWFPFFVAWVVLVLFDKLRGMFRR